jgi:4'-phosphopantetheinyl transferase EntD
MPFLKEIIPKKNIRILIWKIDEKLSELKASFLLTEDQKRELDRRKPISNKKQFLASRKLIKMAQLNDLNNTFYESLSLDRNICYSISHTAKYAVLAVGTQRIGVDIEFLNPKILNIKSKFINVKENHFMKSDNIKLITKLWTSKEAIFKCIYENKLSLKKNIVVEKFDIHSTFGQGEVYLNDKIIPIYLHFSNFENHQLTLSYL